MPTYTYECDNAGHRFEVVQRFSDDPLTACTECGAPVRRVIQPVGVVFKGSGWYITDNRPKSGDSGGSDGKDKSAASDKAEKSPKSEKTPAKVAD